MIRRATFASGRRPTAATAAVLLIGILLSTLAAAAVADDRSRDRIARFDEQAERGRIAIRARIDARVAVQEVLRDALTAQWPIDRRRFRDVILSTDGDDPFADVQAVSFNRRVPVERRAEYERTVRADTSVRDIGYPGFQITPAETDFEDMLVVEYIEPFAGNETALGFDVGSNERRRAAIEQARDLGELIATEPVDLVQTVDEPGLLLISAVYDTTERLLSQPSRRRHFVGVVVTVVRTRELLGGALGPGAGVEIEIYDQGPTERRATDRFGPENLVFDADDTPFVTSDGDADGRVRRLDVDAGGRRWSLMFRPSAELGSRGLPPWSALAIGLLLTAAVVSVLHTVAGARARAEDLADRRTADLRSILASAPDATVVIDAAGTIVLASDRIEGLLGYQPDELVGRPVEVLVPEALRAAHVGHRSLYDAAPDVRMMGGGLELEALRHDGATVPVEISLSPLPAHSLGTVVAALRDVSGQRRAFQELQRANEMQNAFLSTVSHELRTPLTAIEGFARLLLDSPVEFEPEQQRDFMARIMRNSANLGSLIEDLIQYSRLERGTQRLLPEPHDLLEIASDVVEQLGIVVQSHAIAVDGHPTPAFVDRDAVVRIITNLLTNAVRYAPDGGRIHVRVESSDDDRDAVLVIDDEGPGIPPADREHVFQRFWRGEEARTTNHMGTGVGLAVVRDLCEMSGGSIEVTDAPTGGARFIVTLPSTSGSGRSRDLTGDPIHATTPMTD